MTPELITDADLDWLRAALNSANIVEASLCRRLVDEIYRLRAALESQRELKESALGYADAVRNICRCPEAVAAREEVKAFMDSCRACAAVPTTAQGEPLGPNEEKAQ